MRIIGMILCFLLLFTSSCGTAEDDAVSSATQSRYRESEITEYQGVRLDPAVGAAR